MGTITVKIDAGGKPTIDAADFQGTACKRATKGLEDKFRGAELDITEKPELAMLDGAEEHNYMEIPV